MKHQFLKISAILFFRVPIVKRRQPSPVAFGREQRRNSGGRKTYQPSPSERSGSRGRRGVVYRNLSTARSPSPGDISSGYYSLTLC